MTPSPAKKPAGRDMTLDYRTLPGVPDELMTPTGEVRPAWRSFVQHLSGLSDEDLAGRIARGDEYLRDAGVYFRQYGQKGAIDRAWPLSPIPVILHDSEWNAITSALKQRADLLETIAADIYGPNRLVADGLLPAALLAGNAEWLRPMVGVEPAGGSFLHLVAFDIGRGPDGQWWVLEDRVQAPSGSGFALENRVATSRIFPEFYGEAHVHRLAGFFKRFRAALGSLSGDESSVSVLSPGPMTDTYYEHAYIARYLGLSLLEGEDLTVDRGQVMVRSVSGNRPVSVLWRRLDATFADPLEFDGASHLGTPGIVSAVRNGTITMVNALGVGALEAKAFLAFMPGICQHLTGAPLAMPNVATWWCGQDRERQFVQDNIARMAILPAVPAPRRANGQAQSRFGDDGDSRLTPASGRHFVGQEMVTLSTAPAWEEGKLVSRPMSLRVYLGRTPDGWVAMPGGFARIGHSQDPKALTMQEGGSVADVWIVSDRPVANETMTPPVQHAYQRPRQGTLPSRAADNLFWLGRYIERAEATTRLLRAYHARLAEAGDQDSPLVAYVRTCIEDMEIDVDEAVPAALQQMFSSALGSAAKVRDRFSLDGWMALNDLAESARRISRTSTLGADSARAMSVLLRKITGFSGLVHENMYRFVGWRFLSLGRSLERALGIAALMSQFTDDDAPEGALDFAVEVADSTLSHRRRYTLQTTRATVVDLLGLDEMNPRSIAYQLHEIRQQIDLLPGANVNGQPSDLVRAAMRAEMNIASQTAEGLTVDNLIKAFNEIASLSDLITDSYLH